jgi:catechol 2,3-dioxygenase-like lactoylglutathione lyase family enzyme
MTHDGTAEQPGRGMRMSSAVMFVADLAAAIDFYSELLEMRPTVSNGAAALLVNGDGCQLYLRAMSPRAQHPLGGLGVQYVIWTAPYEQVLMRCERS